MTGAKASVGIASSSKMSLHLRFSHRTEALLDGLDALLRMGDPLDPGAPTVVVPSPTLARWIKLRLCERSGPVVGLETTTLESFLWRSLDPSPDEELLRVPLLQQAILAVLDETLLAGPDWNSVRRFLQPTGSPDPRRKVQFAHEMARLFLEYEYNRPSVWNGSWVLRGLDQTWPSGPYFHPADVDPSEAWQRQLHNAVFSRSEVLSAKPGTSLALGLPRLHRLRRDSGWIPSGAPVGLFGVEKVSHFHRNLLLEISRKRDVHAFLHNPCAAFWEDLDTSRRTPRKPRSQGPADPKFRRDEAGDEWSAPDLPERWYPSAAVDPLLLERWGRTARENIALWCQAAEYDFQDLDQEVGAPDTLLGDLQEALRQRHPGPLHQPLERLDGIVREGGSPLDDSLVLLESPDRGREMETLRDQILSWLEQDPSRRPGDVVVYLPDPTRHRVEIERVFGAYAPFDPAWIPWALVGTPSSESLWARGVSALLALLQGTFDRPTIFALLRNPLVHARLGLQARDIAIWERWFEGTGMIRGWDLGDRANEAEPTPVHTMSLGIRRLLLASLCDPTGGRVPGVDLPVPGWKDFDASDTRLLETFCATLETLHHDILVLKRMLATSRPGEVPDALMDLLDRWLDPSALPAEVSVRRSLQDSLRHLARRPEGPMDPDELTEIVKAGLEGELPGSSRAWTGAVTFAPLRPGNILPHRLVLVPGLDADAFPGEPRTSSLDLLAGSRIVGDPDLVADNRHAFLLVLLAARERLVLSWRARDIQKDERKDPSSVVLELEEALRTGFQPRSLRRRIRLLEREAPLDSMELSEPGWDSWERSVPVVDASYPAPGDAASNAPVRLETRDISRFLLDSWTYRIESGLDAVEQEAPDTLGSSDEPLDITDLAHTRLRSDLVPALLGLAWSGAPVEEALAASLSALQAARWDCGFPEGLQARREASDLQEWSRHVWAMGTGFKERWPQARLETGCDLGLRLPGTTNAVELLLQGSRRVRVTARLPMALLLDPSCAQTCPVVVLAPARWNPSSSCPLRKSLEPRLGAHLLELLGRPGSFAILIPTRSGGPLELPPLVADPSWLEEVLHDLVSGAHEFLPASVVVDQDIRSLEEVREALEDATWRPPLQAMLEPNLPGEIQEDSERFAALVERRFAPLFTAPDESEDDQ